MSAKKRFKNSKKRQGVDFDFASLHPPPTDSQGAAAPYWMYPREIRSPSAVGATQARPIQAEQQNQDFGHGAAAVGGQSPIENRPRRPEIARLLARSPRLNGGPGGGKGKHQTFPECLCFHTPPHPRRFFGSFCITAKGTRRPEAAKHPGGHRPPLHGGLGPRAVLGNPPAPLPPL